MLEKYIYHGKEKLRCGYTTGSCAAAAAKAAVIMLLSNSKIDKVILPTPKGIELELKIENIKLEKKYVECSVQKDSGDDPDITNGISIYAKAEKIDNGITIDGGQGIGRVTRKGLDQPVGMAAINSVPRKMIEQNVLEVMDEYEYHRGIKITVFAPEGERLALKTYNSRMGIEGGISIIGTSGIVEPMSNSAIIETIRMEERVKKANGNKNLLLTIGNYSEGFIKEQFPNIDKKGVKCSNFIGEALDAALEYNFEGVLIIGHIGKTVKLGAGIMNTHSANADGRMDVLITCGVIAGVDVETLQRLAGCVTVDEALEILIQKKCLDKVSEILINRAEYYLNAKIKNSIKIGLVMFSNRYGIIGKTTKADELLKTISEEYNG